MAFNPFHKFRKHQKVIFAGLTIFCMFSFVACSGLAGGGDLGHWLMGLVQGQAREEVVATIDGKKITYRQLIQVGEERRLASMFMTEATDLAIKTQALRLQGTAPEKLDPIQRAQLQQKFQNDPVLQNLQARYPINPFTGQQMPYFSGNLTPEGNLDFLVWLHLADKLGIDLSDEDVNNEFNRLTENLLRPQDTGAIERGLSQHMKFSSELLMKALRNEFRARLAQVALGADPSSAARPVPATPEEFWSYFKKQRTEIITNLLPVKVEEFVTQVKDQPTEKELKALYDKYKDKEYQPSAREPGFKQARRIQIEWVSAKPDTPFYQQAAQDYRTITLPTLLMIGRGANAPAGLASAVQLSTPGAVDYLLLREYDNMKWTYSWRSPSYTRNWPIFEQHHRAMHAENVYHPINLAAAVGQAAGLASDAGSLLTVPGTLGTFVSNAAFREMQERLARGLTWALSGSPPTIFPAAPLALAIHLSPTEEFLPLAVVRASVEKHLMDYLVRTLQAEILKSVRKEIETRGKAADKKDLQDYLAQAVPKFALQTGKTSEPRDLHRSKIADDPGLKPLKDAYLRPLIGDPDENRFGSFLFSLDKLYEVQALPRLESLPHLSPQEAFLFWKTEDQPARVLPFTDPAVRQQVEQAWRFDKARALARKAADQLAQQARETKGDERKLKDFAAQNQKELVELPPLARLMARGLGTSQPLPFADRNRLAADYSPPTAQMMIGRNFQPIPPDIPENKVDHAGPDFPNRLLKLLDKERGATEIVPNQPESIYYVAVLVKKQEPSREAFLRVYRQASSAAKMRDPLLQMFEAERQREYFQAVLERVRQEAKLEINAEAMKSFRSGSDGAAEP